jgi:uracil-DNA glycosylase
METLDALRSYVRFLREREGVRDVHLSLAARRGLALLTAVGNKTSAAKATTGAAVVPSAGSRRPLGDGVFPVDRTSLAQTPSPGGRRLPAELPSAAADAVSASGGAAVFLRPPSRAAKSLTPAAPRIEEIIPVSGSTKAEQLAHLAERASGCVKCPHLAARRHSVVFGVGDPEARILFVGEAPGEDEDLQGEPFVGRAGQLLTKMIGAMGLAREQVYIANILKCRPDMPTGSPGNRKPTRDEMDTCLPYLRAQIDVIQPQVLIALGATALEGLLGPVGGISKLRGKFLEYRGIPLMPTFHPSYLLRNASHIEKRKVWEDLMQVMERVAMPISDKQRGFFLSK